MIAPFYLIVDHVRWLERFLPLGLACVQLRIKEVDGTQWRAQIREAKGLCKASGCQLIVNDAWQLALEEGCDFIHLGQEDLDTADIAAIRAGGLKLGISTHSEAELERALSLKPDYVALGPIYPTLLKAMAFAPQGLDRIRQWKRRIGTIPLVAIGGLTVERAQGVFEAGADSLCVVTDILQAANPEARLRQWLMLIRK